MVHLAPDSCSKCEIALEKCLRGCSLALILPESSRNWAKSKQKAPKNETKTLIFGPWAGPSVHVTPGSHWVPKITIETALTTKILRHLAAILTNWDTDH